MSPEGPSRRPIETTGGPGRRDRQERMRPLCFFLFLRRNAGMKKIVVALGGNALQEAGKPATAEAQLEVVEKTAEHR